MWDTEQPGPQAKLSGGLVTIPQNERVTEAARWMHENRVGCLVVVDDDRKMTGIISERDILRWIGELTPETYFQRVGDVMTTEVISADPTTPLAEAQDRMAEHGIRHLPVVEDGILVGMISMRDLVSREVREISV